MLGHRFGGLPVRALTTGLALLFIATGGSLLAGGEVASGVGLLAEVSMSFGGGSFLGGHFGGRIHSLRVGKTNLRDPRMPITRGGVPLNSSPRSGRNPVPLIPHRLTVAGRSGHMPEVHVLKLLLDGLKPPLRRPDKLPANFKQTSTRSTGLPHPCRKNY